MGNMIGVSCMSSKGSFVKVIYWEGNTKILTGRRRLAGEIMFEFPESMVCDADRFFIGHAIPSLSIDDHLMPGKTYFVLPLDIFSTAILTVSSVSAFVASNHRRSPADLIKESPLEYIKGSSGSVLIKVKPEFMARHICCRGGYGYDQDNDHHVANGDHVANGSLCSTPELKKEYEQLVRPRDQIWSPNLDTISEACKIRYSPYRIIGLEWD